MADVKNEPLSLLTAPAHLANTALPFPLQFQLIRPTPIDLFESTQATPILSDIKLLSNAYSTSSESIRVVDLFSPVLMTEHLPNGNDFSQHHSSSALNPPPSKTDAVDFVLLQLFPSDDASDSDSDSSSDSSSDTPTSPWSDQKIATTFVPSEVTKKLALSLSLSTSLDPVLSPISLSLQFFSKLLVVFPSLPLAKHMIGELVPVVFAWASSSSSSPSVSSISTQFELLKSICFRLVHTCELKNNVSSAEFTALVKSGAKLAANNNSSNSNSNSNSNDGGLLEQFWSEVGRTFYQ